MTFEWPVGAREVTVDPVWNCEKVMFCSVCTWQWSSSTKKVNISRSKVEIIITFVTFGWRVVETWQYGDVLTSLLQGMCWLPVILLLTVNYLLHTSLTSHVLSWLLTNPSLACTTHYFLSCLLQQNLFTGMGVRWKLIKSSLETHNDTCN